MDEITVDAYVKEAERICSDCRSVPALLAEDLGRLLRRGWRVLD